MRLAGAVSEGSGPVNEDGWGFAGSESDVMAAWVFDGVTGINSRNYLPAGSDAQWLVARAHYHLMKIAGSTANLPAVVGSLVELLIGDWRGISAGLDLPADYDPPAACLILAKRHDETWQAARLGDSCLLARAGDGAHKILAASPNNQFDNWLAREAEKRRLGGRVDTKALLAEFRPQLLAGRKARNRPGGYSILEASPAAMQFAEYLDLGSPSEILLCTDGFYRAADHYGIYGDEGLIDACAATGGVKAVLQQVRAAEAADPDCQRFLRFKPADDATAVMLRSGP
ncbi:MAG: protein phosphatase 2C domain-containing protein [Hyphomicrobiales bacterium]